MNNRKNHVLRGKLLVVFLLSALVLTACSAAQPAKSESVQDPAALVEDTGISATGEVVPATWTNLSFSNGATGIVFEVSSGDTVTAGQTLVTSDETQLRTAIAQARSTVARAEYALETLKNAPTDEALIAADAAVANALANYDRLARNGVNKIELGAAQAQIDSAEASREVVKAGPSAAQIASAERDLEAAKAALAQAEDALAGAVLTAPFDGQVIEVYANNYETVAPSQAVLLLADLSTLHVDTTDLSEIDVAQIQVGDPARIVFDALPNTTLNGTVTRIALKSTGGSAVYYTVTCSLESIPPELRWGMTAFVVFP